MEVELEQVPRKNKWVLCEEAKSLIDDSIDKIEDISGNPLLEEAKLKIKEAKGFVSDYIKDRFWK
jgi:hypothetical protein